MPIIRTLRAHERESLLDLLDGWQLADGWRGRDFFRRYVEQDAAYADENVWVAVDDRGPGGGLLSCVQIFPRSLRGPGGVALPTGGVGSVFTRPDARGSGVARAVLEAALADMRARGLLASLLFAAPAHVSPGSLYGRLGWASWPSARLVLRAAGAGGPGACERDATLAIGDVDPARDLDAVREIHAAYSGARLGTTLRDTDAWRTSLHVAGNPREEFLVARRDGAVVAYARAVVLYGVLQLSEAGRRDGEDAAQALAALVAHLLTPRADDVLAPDGKPSAELRALLIAPDPRDPALARALAARGVAAQSVPDPSAMLLCLDPDRLAAVSGVERAPCESGESLLRRVLASDRLVFWPADRF